MNICYRFEYWREDISVSIFLYVPSIFETYFLLWLDFNETGLTHEEGGRRLLQKGKIALNDGLTFGEEGRGFRRMNIGCPRKVVQQGLERISQALKRES